MRPKSEPKEKLKMYTLVLTQKDIKVFWYCQSKTVCHIYTFLNQSEVDVFSRGKVQRYAQNSQLLMMGGAGGDEGFLV